MGFVCADSKCNSISGALWNSQVLNTPADLIQLTYPTQLLSQYGYGIYYFKPGYIPWEQNPNWYGTSNSDPQGPYTKYLGKKQDCYAPIDDFTVINDAQPNIPLIINIDASLDATTYAALHSAGPLDYIPTQLQEYYSVKTKITLTIYDSSNNIINEQIQEISIPASGSARVEFTWTPTLAGAYKATAKTDVTDEKCSSSISQDTSKDFTVLSSQPQNSCYTILNNLALSDQFPEDGKTITLSATKISNYADNNYNLQPIPTDVALTITKDSNIIVQQSKTISSNANQYDTRSFSFDWPITTGPGNYNIQISGIASSSLCNGLENLRETISLNSYVTSRPNNAPILDGIPDQTINENEEPSENWIDLLSYASDSDSDELRFTIASQSNSALINCKINDDRYIDCENPSLNQYGYSDITVEVSDGQYADRDTFRINVLPLNYPPYLSFIGNKNINENQLLTFTISASDPDSDPITYSATNLPSGAIFNTLTQTFTWTPDYSQSGSYQVTFSATDGTATDSETITIAVNNVNRAPSLQNIADISINENNIVTITAIASDPDNDILTYSINDTMRFTQNNNIFTWQTDYDSARTYLAIITVNDGSLTDSKTAAITVNNVNRAPAITSAPLTTASEGSQYIYTIIASDPDSDPITYSLTTFPTGMAINNNIITWTPDYSQSGNNDVIISISDSSLTTIQSFTIIVSNTNRDPILSSIGNKNINENQLLTFTISASDPDSDPITYSATNLPSGASFDSNTQTFSWTPDYTQSGSYQVTFSATDGTATDPETITISIGNSNRAPIITSIPPLNATEGEEYIYQVTATDQDNESLSYSLISAPSNMTINSSTGLIIWTPTFDEARIKANNITIKVSDGIDYTIQSFDTAMEHLLHKSHKFSLDITTTADAQSLSQGENYLSYVRLSNKGQLPEEDISVSVSVPELNINFIAEQNIYLGPHDIKYAEINFDIPQDASSGEYLIKINVENNNYNAVGYSTLEIKENKKDKYILLLP